MAPQAPPQPKKSAKSAANQPPDERFWVKYSPNHELPLSSVASLAWHVLGLVLLVAVGYVIAWNSGKDMPVDTIEFDGGGGGAGGGGGLNGIGGTGAPAPQEAVAKNNNPTPMPDISKAPETPEVKDTLNRPEVQNNPDDDRLLVEAAKARKAAQALGGLTSMTPTPGPSGGGGTGEVGGPGKGPGAPGGDGPPGPGGNIRTRRQVRWTMSFTTENGEDYL